jgi:hypothetical protein
VDLTFPFGCLTPHLSNKFTKPLATSSKLLKSIINYLNKDDPWKGILAATAFAIRATYYTTLQKSPGQLVFGRDMIFNAQHAANWEYIRARK